MGNRSYVNPYISDGLIFWLDGINKKQNVGVVWEDLIGGVQFVAYENNNDSVCFDSIVKANSPILPASENYTVEIVFKNIGKNRPILSCGDATKDHVCINRRNNNTDFGFLQREQAWKCDFSSSVPHVISANISRCCEDYQEITTKGSEEADKGLWNEADNRWMIFSRGVGGTNYFFAEPFVSTLYCIRIYNRQLTLAEMKANQAVDNERFNLGLTIPTT